MPKWTRERIIRDILRQEEAGLPVTSPAGDGGVPIAMYQAASRIFGSWTNAIVAAGLPASRARSNGEWTPARIKRIIRSLSRRATHPSTAELTKKHGYLVQAARRHFGSWSNAVMASGIDPQRLRRAPAWTKERVIENILRRALRNEPLRRSLVQPRTLAEAGSRLFGSWNAALESAGITMTPPAKRLETRSDQEASQREQIRAITDKAPLESMPHRRGASWTDQEIRNAVMHRLQLQKPLYASAVRTDDGPLYRAATKRFGNWIATLIAAGIAPHQHRKPPGTAR